MPDDGPVPAQIEGVRRGEPKKMEAPQYADFALVTINEAEDKAVRHVFKEFIHPDNRESNHRGVYAWGLVPTPPGDLVIVHASTGDMKGPIPATDLIRELDQRFKPHYLLVLGTAGGIRARGVDYGSVIYSRQVHAGYQQLLDKEEELKEGVSDVEVRLFDDPVQPPFNLLYFHAKNVASAWTPNRDTLANKPEDVIANIETYVNTYAIKARETTNGKEAAIKNESWFKEVQKALEDSLKMNPVATEIFSGSYLIDGRNSELFKSLKRTFPKVGANEMEAGAIAQAVLRSIEVDRFVGYLIIKGISDVVDSTVPGKHRKDVRKAVSPYAGELSAAFARQFIESWNGDDARSIGRLSLVPPRYASLIQEYSMRRRASNSIVYEDFGLADYSHLLKDLCDEDHVTSVWTFCYLAPYRFFADLREKSGAASEADNSVQGVGSEDTDKRDAEEVLESYKTRKEELLMKLKERYPHFEVFIQAAKKKPNNVVRILHKGDNWDKDNCRFLDLFAKVTGHDETGIVCHAIKGEALDSIEHWLRSDHVVLDDELLLEYDKRSRRLIVTYLDPGPTGLRNGFMSFRDHCRQLSNPSNEYSNEMKRIQMEFKCS